MKFKQWGVGTPDIPTILFRKHNKVRRYLTLAIIITMSEMTSKIRDDMMRQCLDHGTNKRESIRMKFEG
jgi:hypothetical protein